MEKRNVDQIDEYLAKYSREIGFVPQRKGGKKFT